MSGGRGGAENGRPRVSRSEVGAGRGGCGWYAEGRLGVGYGRNGDGDGQMIRWEYTVANVILGTEPNAPLAYAPVLELHHPIMNMLGAHVGQ